MNRDLRLRRQCLPLGHPRLFEMTRTRRIGFAGRRRRPYPSWTARPGHMRVRQTECGVTVSTVAVTAAHINLRHFSTGIVVVVGATGVPRSACLQVLIHEGLFGVGLVISGALQGHNGAAAMVVAAKPSRRGRTHFVPQRGRAPWLP